MPYRLIIMFCLTLANSSLASATSASSINLMNVEFNPAVSIFDSQPQHSPELFTQQTVVKDTAQRRGTENWEEPQGSFFVIPGLVLAIIAAALFFNRD